MIIIMIVLAINDDDHWSLIIITMIHEWESIWICNVFGILYSASLLCLPYFSPDDDDEKYVGDQNDRQYIGDGYDQYEDIINVLVINIINDH